MIEYFALTIGDLNKFVQAIEEQSSTGEWRVIASNAFVDADGNNMYYALMEKSDDKSWKEDLFNEVQRIANKD